MHRSGFNLSVLAYARSSEFTWWFGLCVLVEFEKIVTSMYKRPLYDSYMLCRSIPRACASSITELEQ